jgi:hypothetical protein
VIPQLGFLPPGERRVRGTVDAIARDLVVDGLVLRYWTVTDVDRLPPPAAHARGRRQTRHRPGERPVAVAQAT